MWNWIEATYWNFWYNIMGESPSDWLLREWGLTHEMMLAITLFLLCLSVGYILYLRLRASQ